MAAECVTSWSSYSKTNNRGFHIESIRATECSYLEPQLKRPRRQVPQSQVLHQASSFKLLICSDFAWPALMPSFRRRDAALWLRLHDVMSRFVCSFSLFVFLSEMPNHRITQLLRTRTLEVQHHLSSFLQIGTAQMSVELRRPRRCAVHCTVSSMWVLLYRRTYVF